MISSGDPTVRANGEPPLAVDLDGTLIHTDCLVEGGVQAFKRNLLLPLLFPWWLLRGKAVLKREIANRTELDVAFLPYNEPLLHHLREQRQHRRLVLCTSADQRFASAVATHLGIFDEVIATKDQVNLSASNKARALVERYGKGAFDYAGNDTPDLCVFAAARRSLVINPTFGLRRRLRRITNLERVEQTRPGFSLQPYLRAIRPHQWAKNLLVLVPLLATLNMAYLAPVVPALLAFLAFCLVASSGYLLNDLFDLNADRRHPRKRFRPLAAGILPVQHGLLMIPVLLIIAGLTAVQLPALFVVALALYALATGLYTFWLKRVPLLDTLVLAGLYTLRILAGAAAISVEPSVWLLSFSMFFFLSLALAKRHSELIEMEGAPQPGTIPGREYRTEDLQILISQGTASGYAAVLVLAFYIDSQEVKLHYNHPEIIWLICPLILYWINKLWLNSARRQINDDPVVWAIRNRVSRGIGVLSVGLLLLARWLP